MTKNLTKKEEKNLTKKELKKYSKIASKDVEVGLKMVVPKLSKVNLSNFKKNLENVGKFLTEIKGDRKKWFLTMSVDYFNCLLTYYQDILKLDGFRVSHIDTDLAKDLYREFLENRGSLYWNDGSLKDSKTVMASGTTIFLDEEDNARDIDLQVIQETLRLKYGDKSPKTVRTRKGVLRNV